MVHWVWLDADPAPSSAAVVEEGVGDALVVVGGHVQIDPVGAVPEEQVEEGTVMPKVGSTCMGSVNKPS